MLIPFTSGVVPPSDTRWQRKATLSCCYSTVVPPDIITGDHCLLTVIIDYIFK